MLSVRRPLCIEVAGPLQPLQEKLALLWCPAPAPPAMQPFACSMQGMVRIELRIIDHILHCWPFANRVDKYRPLLRLDQGLLLGIYLCKHYRCNVQRPFQNKLAQLMLFSGFVNLALLRQSLHRLEFT